MAESKPAIIRMRKLSFYAFHGNSEAEKEVGGRYEIDCEFGIDIERVSKSDSLEDTLDYSKMYQEIENIVTGNRFNLIETLADRLADTILERFDIGNVRVRVRKMTPPIPGDIGYIEIETERSR